MTGNDVVVILQESDESEYKQSVSTNVVALLDSLHYESFYLRIENNVFSIGSTGNNDPFITIAGDMNASSINSAIFEGLGEPCSCEDGSSCTTAVVATDWRICDDCKSYCKFRSPGFSSMSEMTRNIIIMLLIRM